jgi:hypothetical protein
MLISEKIIHRRWNVDAAQLDIQCDFSVEVWNCHQVFQKIWYIEFDRWHKGQFVVER